MPYPSGHRDKVRDRIVDCARRLFNRKGFEGVTIDAIMASAGLTRGAFYAYFDSKSDLYSEVLGCFFTDPHWAHRWKGVKVDLSSPDAGQQIVRAYLSQQHLDDIENSCPMVALPSDVSRSGVKVKAAFEGVIEAMVRILSGEVRNQRQPERVAMAIASLCVGGMVVARSLNDAGFSARFRDASIEAALLLAGWKPAVNGRSRRAASPNTARIAARSR